MQAVPESQQCLLPTGGSEAPRFFNGIFLHSGPGACTTSLATAGSLCPPGVQPSGQDNWLAAKPCFMEGRTHQLPLNCTRISELLLFFVFLTKPMA